MEIQPLKWETSKKSNMDMVGYNTIFFFQDKKQIVLIWTKLQSGRATHQKEIDTKH